MKTPSIPVNHDCTKGKTRDNGATDKAAIQRV